MFGFLKNKNKNHDDDITPEEQAHIDSIKGNNPYGMIVFFLGGLSFIIGYMYVFIPIITIIIGLLTFRTFDKEKEDNRWSFYIGIILALIGISLFISHHPPIVA
jgi:hypothetical protein